MSRLALAALLVAVLLPPLAHAAPSQRVAVLTLQSEAGVDEPELNHLREALRAGLAARGLEALPVAEVDRLLLATDLSCSDSGCLERSARTIGVDLLVGGQVSRSADSSWTVALWLFASHRRATLATVQERCDSCGFEQAVQLLDRAVEALWTEGQQDGQRAQLVVRSSPPGAEVSIDGTPMGVTEMTFGVAPGVHNVALRLAGHQLHVEEVTVAPGQSQLVQVTLTPTARGDAAAPRRPAQLAWLKWTLAGAAVVSLAAGVALWASGKEESATAAQAEKPALRDYTPAGIALTALGAALAAGAGITFWLDARPPPAAASSRPAGALLLGYKGRF